MQSHLCLFGAQRKGFDTYAITNSVDCKKLCDAGAGFGSVQCSARGCGCAGATNSNCYPCDFWSSSSAGTSAGYADFWFGNGSVGGDGRPTAFAVSVRCLF